MVCNQSIYAAIRRSEDNFTLPMGDPAMTNSYMGLAYDIERSGLQDKAYPAVRRHVDIGEYSYSDSTHVQYNNNYSYCWLSIDLMSGSNGERFSSCTPSYMDKTASVSCVDSTSSGYQVILLQDNDPHTHIT